jgi:hypothetical protein
MTEFERLEGKVAALTLRVAGHDRTLQALMTSSADDLAARRAAQQMGVGVEILILPARAGERRALAWQLSKQGWSADRIARVLRCAGRTVERWLASARRRPVSGHADS